MSWGERLRASIQLEALEGRRLMAADYVSGIQLHELGSSPENFVNLNGKLLFTADDGIHGEELWQSDGSDGGTWMVKDITPGTPGSSISTIVNAGSFVLFEADHSKQLWVSDGTEAGTHQVMGTSGYYSRLDVSLGHAFFNQPSGGTLPDGLYRVSADGSAVRVSAGAVSPLVTMGNATYYSDGRPVRLDAGSDQAVDLAPNNGFSGVATVQTLGGDAYFLTDRVNGAISLWKVPGGNGEATKVTDIAVTSSISLSTTTLSFGSRFLFTLPQDNGGNPLWWTDGTAAGTRQMPQKLSLRSTVDAGGKTYLDVINTAGDNELWVTDGTDAGTIKIAKVQPGQQYGTKYTPSGDDLYFVKTTDNGVKQYWKTDGTTARTVQTSADDQPSTAFQVGNQFYSVQSQDDTGLELYVSDGNSAPLLVKNINTQYPDPAPSELATLGGLTFFTADDGAHGRELWVTDGTAAGTHLLRDIAPGLASSQISQVVAFGNYVYFGAFDSTANKLWRSDGTAAGTTVVATPGDSISNLLVIGGELHYQAGYSLYRTDGTAAGTKRVSTSLGQILGADGYLYFLSSNHTVSRTAGYGDLSQYFTTGDNVIGEHFSVVNGYITFQYGYTTGGGPDPAYHNKTNTLVLAATGPVPTLPPPAGTQTTSSTGTTSTNASILHASLKSGVLRVYGTDATNQILVIQNLADHKWEIAVDSAEKDYALADINSVIIYGGAGDDTISLSGAAIKSKLYGEAGNDVIYGGAGKDRIYGGDGDDWISGGDNHDTIYGEAGDDKLFGDAGHDYLVGGAGSNTLRGGEGMDHLIFGSIDDIHGNNGDKMTVDDIVG